MGRRSSPAQPPEKTRASGKNSKDSHKSHSRRRKAEVVEAEAADHHLSQADYAFWTVGIAGVLGAAIAGFIAYSRRPTSRPRIAHRRPAGVAGPEFERHVADVP